MDDDKLKMLKDIITKIERDNGKGSIIMLGDSAHDSSIESISTGSISLDIALGVGGVPKGRIIEVYGPESSGKTTIALNIIAEVQKKGGIAAFIDVENALDPLYAKNIGVNLNELYISQPDNGNEALEITETMIASNAIDIIVIDSVAALVPKQEIEGEMGDSHIGLQARLMSQALRKLTHIISKSNCIVVFINQLREKIGNRTRVRVVKNKVAPPFKEAEFDIVFGQGISKEGDILDLAVKIGKVDKSGAWYIYNNERIGQGRENVKEYLRNNLDIMEELEKSIREYYNLC